MPVYFLKFFVPCCQGYDHFIQYISNCFESSKNLIDSIYAQFHGIFGQQCHFQYHETTYRIWIFINVFYFRKIDAERSYNTVINPCNFFLGYVFSVMHLIFDTLKFLFHSRKHIKLLCIDQHIDFKLLAPMMALFPRRQQTRRNFFWYMGMTSIDLFSARPMCHHKSSS